MTIINKVLDNSFFTGIKFVSSFLVNFLIAKLFINPSYYGLFLYSLTVIDILAAIGTLGTGEYVIRYSSKLEIKNLNILISKILIYSLFIFAFFALISLLFHKQILFFFNFGNNIYLIFIFCILPLKVISTIYTNISWGQNNFVLKGINQSLAPFMRLLIFILIYFLCDLNTHFHIIFLTYFISEVLSATVNTFLIKKRFEINFVSLSKNELLEFNKYKNTLKYGIWSLVAIVGMLMMNFIDKYFINKFISSTILGKYSLISSISTYAIIGITVVSNVIMTNYLKKWETNKVYVIKQIHKIFSIVLLFLLIIGGLLHFFFPFLIDFFFSSEFLGIEKYYLLILSAQIFQVYYIIYGNLSVITENPKITTISFMPALVVNIIGNSLFVSKYGIIAVFLTTIISYFFIATSIYFQFFKLLKLNIFTYLITIVISCSLLYYVLNLVL